MNSVGPAEPSRVALDFDNEEGVLCENPSCFETATKVCSVCRNAFYCSKNCWNQDSENHKGSCISLQGSGSQNREEVVDVDSASDSSSDNGSVIRRDREILEIIPEGFEPESSGEEE